MSRRCMVSEWLTLFQSVAEVSQVNVDCTQRNVRIAAAGSTATASVTCDAGVMTDIRARGVRGYAAVDVYVLGCWLTERQLHGLEALHHAHQLLHWRRQPLV